MNPTYSHKETEEKIYKGWEEGGYFTPKIDPSKKPFTILLPLPNANDPMHMGHCLFTIQDILIRWHRMKGDPTLWLPGGDHAGIETQFVFEKYLAKEGKSRLDYDRETLYNLISYFVEKNKDVNKGQLKRLGFSLDWTRYKYSLDPLLLNTVFDTFRKLHSDKLLYRAERLVNYCVKCGTALSDLECTHEERQDKLYYLNYGTINIATTRPETIFADVAVAVNPKDKRYKNLVGKTATIPLINKVIPIITDPQIELKFGTGALKVTPAHDALDFEIGQKNKLGIIQILDRRGRLVNVPQKYLGLKVLPAREAIVADLKNAGLLIREEDLTHTVNICYKCKSVLEPMLVPQWYVKTKTLAQKALEAVKNGETKIVPKKRFEKMYKDWLENIHDWNISRQIVWGPRMPAWYCLKCNPAIFISFVDRAGQKTEGYYKELQKNYSFEEIEKGLQSISVPISAKYYLEGNACEKCGGEALLQETDTFDTWFLSGQWPLSTLGFPDSEDFKYFYPTAVLDTLWDILFFWVARMMMLGIYRTGKAPFETIHIHARVVDKSGQKMSKSKGNGIDPIEMVEKYGADALRMSLIYGVAPASDVAIYEEKIKAMRNFSNKIWNIGRFIQMETESVGEDIPSYSKEMDPYLKGEDKAILKELKKVVLDTDKYLENYRFADSAECLYQFIWHTVADKYVETVKGRTDKKIALGVLSYIFLQTLKLLHPFMPFITEELWGLLNQNRDKTPLIVSKWPSAK